MRVRIRADASSSLGAGHVMRCLALAEALRTQGADVGFLCQSLPGDLRSTIAARGYTVATVVAPADEVGDAASCLAALDGPLDWAVVDHYALGFAWETAVRAKAARVLVIDDLADRAHDCDLMLDQNLRTDTADSYAGLLPPDCRRLLGPRYALLRPQFAAAREGLRIRDGRVSRILVFYGGGDAGGETLKALEALAQLDRPGVAVDVVVGQANPHCAAIDAACRELRDCTLHCEVSDMASLVAAADLSLGAGGTAAWERCCLGLPALVSALAVNQVEPARALAEAGCQIYLGWAAELRAEAYARHLSALLTLPELLRHMGRQGMALVDGRGAARVARELVAADLRLRPVRREDSAAIYYWRNHPDNRRHALMTAPITVEEHARWFTVGLANADRIMLLAEDNGAPVGVLRYDLVGDSATVSIYTVPGMAGRGYGRRMLLAGEDWLARQRPALASLRAEVRTANEASIGAFRAANYDHAESVFTKDIRGNA